MKSNAPDIVKAIKVLKEENPDSQAIAILEEALRTSMKMYVLDMANMSSVIDMDEVEEEFRNGLKLLGIMGKR